MPDEREVTHEPGNDRTILRSLHRGDIEGMLATLHEDFAHHVNEGAVRLGRAAFADFCRHMSETYREELTDMVVFASDDGTRAAAEFVVNGTYLKTDPGLPEARGQTYVLDAGRVLHAEGRQDHPRHDLLQPV